MNLGLVFRFILGVIGCYRAAEFLTFDDGPAMIIHKFRLWLGKRAAKTKRVAFWHQLADSVYCVFCSGYLVAPVFLVLVLVPTFPGDVILIWFGIMGGQTMLENLAPRLEESRRKEL